MTDSDNEDAARLIRKFLADNPSPTTDDWKQLIDANQSHAAAIADAAIIKDVVPSAGEEQSKVVNETAFDATISSILNAVHQTPSHLLIDAKEKVDATLGPKARKLAADLGIGPYASLLNGVLVGRILAPNTILRALSQKLEVSVAALSEVFARNYSESALPAFKNTDGKPHVATSPQTWEQSVTSMQLPPEETERLLQLSSQD